MRRFRNRINGEIYKQDISSMSVQPTGLYIPETIPVGENSLHLWHSIPSRFIENNEDWIEIIEEGAGIEEQITRRPASTTVTIQDIRDAVAALDRPTRTERIPTWRVNEFEAVSTGSIFSLQGRDAYGSNAMPSRYTLDSMLNDERGSVSTGHWRIKSVTRLSDDEVFTIGDTVEYGGHGEWHVDSRSNITKFVIIRNRIEANREEIMIHTDASSFDNEPNPNGWATLSESVRKVNSERIERDHSEPLSMLSSTMSTTYNSAYNWLTTEAIVEEEFEIPADGKFTIHDIRKALLKDFDETDIKEIMKCFKKEE